MKKIDTVGYQGNTKSGKGEWLTPPSLMSRLGKFDLDPCAPKVRPWDTARVHYWENGLQYPWFGRVWCNPPYDQCGPWFNRCADHGNALGLCFNRTETDWFDEVVWKRADAILFIHGRLRFYNVDGTIGKDSAGAGSVLVAYGEMQSDFLKHLFVDGHYIKLK